MSLDALRWAFKQKTGKASDKSVLISLADRADENFCCYPSLKRLSLDTELDRKTVVSCLDRLEARGFISDTGARAGRTSSVKVYQLVGCIGRESNTENGTAITPPKKRGKCSTGKSKAVPKTGPLSSTKNGTAKQYQKRDRLSAEAVPVFPEAVPKTERVSSTENGTENLSVNNHPVEPGESNSQYLVNSNNATQNEPDEITPPGFCETSIPEWLDLELWEHWSKYRQCRIPLAWDYPEQAMCIGHLQQAHAQGQDLREVIANAMRRHWKYPYPLKGAARSQGVPIKEVVDLYNQICVPAGMLPCTNMNPEREALIARRVRDGGMTLEDWKIFFEHAGKKPHLTGKSQPGPGYDGPFRASIDNLINNKGFARLDEELHAEVN